MASYVTISVRNAYGQKGAYVARIRGTHPKFGLDREFLAGLDPRITEPGIYEDCDVDRKGRKDKGYWFVVADQNGDLQKVRAREDTVFELLKLGRPVSDLVLRRTDEGKLSCRRADGTLNWRDVTQPASAPEQSAASDPSDALSRIEASAAYLTESASAANMSADELRAAVAKIRDIARAALGMAIE